MKKLIFVFFAIIALVSCGRSEDETDNTSVVGKWNWVSTSGGIANTTTTPSSTGKTIVLNLNSDNTFSYTTNGTVTSRGNYTLYKDISNLSHYEATFIKFSGSSMASIIVTQNDQLILSDDVSDGFTSIYQK
jgi:hypothetical protein